MAEKQDYNNFYKFKGTVVDIFDRHTGVSVNGEWESLKILIEENDHHKKYCFEVFGKDKVDKCDFKVGEYVIITFYLHCKEYNGKYYTTPRVWSCYKVQAKDNFKNMGNVESKEAPKEENKITDVSDLPF